MRQRGCSRAARKELVAHFKSEALHLRSQLGGLRQQIVGEAREPEDTRHVVVLRCEMKELLSRCDDRSAQLGVAVSRVLHRPAAFVIASHSPKLRSQGSAWAHRRILLLSSRVQKRRRAAYNRQRANQPAPRHSGIRSYQMLRHPCSSERLGGLVLAGSA